VSHNNEHIDFSLLEKYFSGKMSAAEKHALEMKAQSDPFLADAMEGYANNPEGLANVKGHIDKQKKANKSFFGSRTIAVLAVACGVYLIAFMFYKPEKDSVQLIDDDTHEMAEELVEVEVLPESIDSFQIVSSEEQIGVSEIVEAHSSIEIEKTNSQDSFVIYHDKITFDEDIESVEYFEIEEEFSEQNITVYAPSVFLEDLYVVDYREIKRSGTSINYTKYELSGVSAAFENDSIRNSTDLIEKQVEVPYVDYLETSMYYFAGGKFKKGLNRYLTILEQYPKDLNALFYGGHCYYNMKKYQKALNFFELALEYENEKGFVAFRQESKWYLAKTLIKLKNYGRAKKILDEIIIEGLFYSKDAMKLKESL
jgi:tetratricopeptide (TPR) repeat protein